MQDVDTLYWRSRRPTVVVVAVCLLLAEALLGAVPQRVLSALSAPSLLEWWFLPYYPGGWVVALLQVVFSLLLLRGVAWSRYAVAAVVLGQLLEQLTTSLSPQYRSFPLAIARDAVSALALSAAVVLVFRPSASNWFNRRKAQ